MINDKYREALRQSQEAQRLWNSFSPEQKKTALNLYAEYYNKKTKDKRK
jgi:type II secretory pathway component PulL